ncbi:hypothetical protein [Cerasicoccus arenae]|uniref:Uncharacterized protein n=1 Tax=Cerasicoccus arenae TaxID=424488 RepID=A0A8J3GDX4_9BACT|nr:hypothetical protein [Cerasicoccus arenae]MBK1857638.1 hypothetical protein [Cerasicoccus arenae]GHC05406.1 hypothetical protein GCM10007047_22880 [Cerasicoccus arenae]
MARTKRNLILLSLFLFVFSTGYSAPESGEDLVKFRLLSISNAVSFLYDQGGTTERVYTSSTAFTGWYVAPPSGKLVFYQEEAMPDAPKTKLKKILANVQLPSGPGPFLIIVKQKPNSQELSTVVLDHSIAMHPEMNYRAFNLSKRRMAVRLADQDMLLESGKSALAPYPNNRKTWLKIAVDDKDSGWMKVVSKPRPVDNNSRTTIIILDIPPSDRDPEPIGVIVREVREQIVESESGTEIL